METLKLTAVLMLAIIAGTTAVYACDSEDVYEGRCYKFIDTKKTWADASSDCNLRGGYLATIKSQEEQAHVQNVLTKNPTYKVWIGLTDEATEGTFVWVDNNEKATYTNWRDQYQPDNFENNQDCGSVHAEEGVHLFGWDDMACTWVLPYMCEYPARGPCAVEGDIRVTDGPQDSDNEGRVEMFMNGNWGTICDVGFNTNGQGWPLVFCRQLGFSAVKASHVKDKGLPTSTRGIAAQDLYCSPGQVTLMKDCGYILKQCGHDDDVYVECSGQYP